jgi:hypothetical protein
LISKPIGIARANSASQRAQAFAPGQCVMRPRLTSTRDVLIV